MGYFDDLLPNTQAPQTYIRQGASVISPAKQATATMGTAYRSLLVPTDFLQVSTQGATPEQILINAWGACGTATGESLTVAGPYLGSQSTDSLALPIPSAPQPGDSIRVTRFSRTSTRAITHKIAKQKRQPFLQDMRPLGGIIIKHYGTYSFVDANGVTHQPPGKRDPVVQLPGVGANIDNDTIKFDANGRMYADLFNQGAADGSGASVATVAGLTAGHGIELIPGFIPTESPTVVVEAGGSVPAGSYAYMYVWLYGTVRTPQSPSVSCTTIDGPPTDYHQPHLTIPGKDDINHATGIELYRKDATVGANGTIQTKFAYTTTPGVLITDPSTGATVITTGAYTGMYQYTVLSTHTGVDAGDEFEYNPLVRVKAGDPPIPYDPRDGSLTTLVENGAADGSSIFKTKDGGAFNQLTGAITYPQDNPLNHSGFRLVDTLTPQHDPQDYIDTKTDAMLGALYVRTSTSINVKPARYTNAPFSSMSAVPGTTPPVYELSGFGFSSTDPLVSNDGAYIRTNHGTILSKTNDVEMLLAAGGTQRLGWATATSLVPGYDAAIRNYSGFKFGGDSAQGARLNLAAYQTAATPTVPVSQTVTWLQEPETGSTKKLKSGLRVDAGDTHDQVVIDQAMQTINGTRVPMGLLVGIGDDGNAVGAYPDMTSIDYDNNGALRARAAEGLGLPPPTTIISPPIITTDPPGTVCQPIVTAPDGTTTQSCTTTTTGPPPPGTGTGDQNAPPTTIPDPGAPPGTTPGTDTPGFDCSGSATTQLALGSFTYGSFNGTDPLAPLFGPDGFTHQASIRTDSHVIELPARMAPNGNWIQGHVTLGPFIPQFNYIIGAKFGTGDDFHANDIKGIVAGFNGASTPTWGQIGGNNAITSPIQPGLDTYWALYVKCDGTVTWYLGTSDSEFTEIHTEDVPYGSGAPFNWHFRAMDITFTMPFGSIYAKVDHLLTYAGMPAGVTIHNINGSGTTYAGTGSNTTNAYPGDTSGLTPVNSGVTTTTVQPPASGGAVSVALIDAGQLAINGDPANAVISGGDVIGGQWGMSPQGEAVITDVNTGAQYALPTLTMPSGTPGAAGGGGFWPGA